MIQCTLLVCLGHNPSNDGHVALGEQLEQISKSMGISIDVAWKDPMASVGEVSHADGVIVPNGPTPSFDSQVLGCKTARESGIPFLGICGGLQAAAVDVARHLASLSEANSVEYAPDTSVPIVHEDGKPCIRTPRTIQFVPGRYLAKLYGSETMEGIVRCGRFVNQKYWPQLERAGLELLATRLMEELETRLRNQGASQVSLLIEDNNDPAISLYKKMDYEFSEGVSYMRKRLS